MNDRNPYGILNNRRFLTVEETAEILGLSPRTIYNQVSRRAKKQFPIRPKRVGRLVKFDSKDVEAYMDSL